MPWFLHEVVASYGRILFAEFFVGSVLFLSWSLAARLGPSPVYVRWSAWIVAAQFWLTAAFHILLALHEFNLTGAFLVALGGSALGLILQRKAPTFGLLNQFRCGKRWLASSLRSNPFLWIILPLLLAQVAICLIEPALGYDYLTYHGVKAAFWVQQGGPAQFTAPGGWSFYQYFAAQGSISTAWIMLLSHSVRLVSATSCLYWPFFYLSVYGLARELGLVPRRAWLLAGFMATLPVVLASKSEGLVDLTLHANLLCALVFCLRGWRMRTTSLLPWQGMAVGMAAATKLTGLSLAAILLAAPCLFLGKSIKLRPWMGQWALAFFLCAVPILPWLLYAYAGTGYPLSPFPVTVAGVTLGKASPEMAWYLQMPIPSDHSRWLGEFLAFSRMFINGWYLRLDPFVLPFLFCAPVGFYQLLKRDVRAAILLLAIAFAFGLFYSGSSFTPVRLNFAPINGRFFLTLIACGVLLGYQALGRWQHRADLLILFAVLLEMTYAASQSWLPEDTYLLSFLLLILGGFWYLTWRFLSGFMRVLAAVFLLLPVTIWGLACAYDSTRLIYYGSSLVSLPDNFASSLRFLDNKPQHPLNIAVTSGPLIRNDRDVYLPFFGTDLQNSVFYLPISVADKILADNDPARARLANYEAWFGRVKKKHIDYVVSLSPRALELDWMEGHPLSFQKVAGSDDPHPGSYILGGHDLGLSTGWGIFRVLPTR